MTLNLWGVPFAKDRWIRMGVISHWLQTAAAGSVDIIGIQEIFVEWDVHRVVEARGAAGWRTTTTSGRGRVYSLMHPACWCCPGTPLSIHFHRYSVNGKPHKIHHIDWWFARAWAWCARTWRTAARGRVCHPPGVLLRAVGRGFPEDEYAAQRAAQAWECARWIGHMRRSPWRSSCAT